MIDIRPAPPGPRAPVLARRGGRANQLPRPDQRRLREVHPAGGRRAPRRADLRARAGSRPGARRRRESHRAPTGDGREPALRGSGEALAPRLLDVAALRRPRPPASDHVGGGGGPPGYPERPRGACKKRAGPGSFAAGGARESRRRPPFIWAVMRSVYTPNIYRTMFASETPPAGRASTPNSRRR